jgi:hypothetical protein
VPRLRRLRPQHRGQRRHQTCPYPSLHGLSIRPAASTRCDRCHTIPPPVTLDTTPLHGIQ